MADTKTKPRVQSEAPRDEQPKGAIALAMQPRLPYIPELEKHYQIDRGLWRTLTDAICPNAKTQSGILLYWEYCKARQLDPFGRYCHLVPVWDSKLDNGPNQKAGGYREGIWPGIAGVRVTAFRTREYAGLDPVVAGPMKTRVFKGQMSKWENRQQVFYDEEIEVTFPEWAQVTVWRLVQGRRVAFHGPQVYWEETYGMLGKSELPNEMWRKRARGQLFKCAEAAAIRAGFPEALGGDMVYEELRQVEPRREDIPPRPTAEQIEHKLTESRPDEIRRKLEEAARERAERDEEAAVATQRTARAARTPQDAKEPARDPEAPEGEETSPGEDGGQGDPDQAFVLVDFNGHIMPLPASGGYSGPDPALYVEALCRLLRRSAGADAANTIYEHNRHDITRLPPELLLQVDQAMADKQKKP